MEIREASAFVMSLKGAALSCLFLMYAMRERRRNWTRNDLADLTGWSRERVATGLRRLTVHELVFQQNYECWQLTEIGYQLAFEDLKVSLKDSESQFLNDSVVVVLKNHDHDNNHDHEPLPPLPRVSLNDSYRAGETPFDGLAQELIAYGCAPLKAREAIVEALSRPTSAKQIKLRMLWWRVYCQAHPSIQHPGNLISARVAKGIDKPIDFGIKDIPDRFYELGQEIEDLEREIEAARQGVKR